MSETSFNMSTVTDENLRDVPEDAEQMKKGLVNLLEKSQVEKDGVRKAALLAKAGLLARALDDLDNSANLISEAIEILKENGLKAKAFELKIRLSIVHIYQGKFADAEKFFNDIIEKANSKQPSDETLDKLKEMALVGLGKSKFEQKKFSGAVRNFAEAGEMKAARGDTSGFNRCNESQKIAQAKINQATGSTSVESEPDNYIDPLLGGDVSDDE